MFHSERWSNGSINIELQATELTFRFTSMPAMTVDTGLKHFFVRSSTIPECTCCHSKELEKLLSVLATSGISTDVASMMPDLET